MTEAEGKWVRALDAVGRGLGWASAHASQIAVAIALLHVLAGLVALWQIGPIEAGDAHRYIDAAEAMRRGEPIAGDARSYPAYVALIAAAQAVGAGLSGVVAAQVLVGGLATLALYRVASRVAGPVAGLLAAAILAVNVDVGRWHLYVLTESLYISGVAISIWAVTELRSRSWSFWPAAAAIVAITTLVRPHGWLLLPVLFIYAVWSLVAGTRRRRLVVTTGAAAVAALVVVTLPGGVSDMASGLIPPYKHLVAGEVIWSYEDGRLDMPAAPVTGDETPSDVVAYALEHPIATLRLMTARIATTLVHVRPFYSTLHNAAIVLTLAPLYLFAAVGVVLGRKAVETWLLVGVFLVHLVPVAVAYADWDGRYLLYPMPALTVLAAVGVIALLRGWAPAPLASRIPA